jgi:hypothetical protein
MSRNARRRGQAALEFLSTYGFAFLLILVMIGALSYFGILSPSKFLPGRCLVSNEFTCKDRQIVGGGDTTVMSIMLTNNLGSQLTINSAEANSSYGNVVCDAAVPASVVSGQDTEIVCDFTNDATAEFPAVGEKAKIAFTISYTMLGGDYPRIAQGEVADTIQ